MNKRVEFKNSPANEASQVRELLKRDFSTVYVQKPADKFTLQDCFIELQLKMGMNLQRLVSNIKQTDCSTRFDLKMQSMNRLKTFGNANICVIHHQKLKALEISNHAEYSIIFLKVDMYVDIQLAEI